MSSIAQERPAQDGSKGRKVRGPYIQRACVECKRRKQRCTGSDPCKNCAGRSALCVYEACESSNSLETANCFRAMSCQADSLNIVLQKMQAEIQALKAATGVDSMDDLDAPPTKTKQRTIGEERQSKKRKAPVPATLTLQKPIFQNSRYSGLTSTEYSLKLASLKLANLEDPNGRQTSNLDACYDRESTRDGIHSNYCPSQAEDSIETQSVSARVFCEIPRSRGRDLVKIYSEVVGSLHPIVNIPAALDCIDDIYGLFDQERQTPTKKAGWYDVNVVRLVFAIALLTEERPNGTLVELCFEGMDQELGKIMSSETGSLKGIILILLMAIYHLFSSRLRMAWRLCGISASLAMELGLHRPESLQRGFPDEGERSEAVRVLWSIYVLDHGWSAALGLPRTFGDAALDRTHPIDDCPYLQAMASYCAISKKIVSATSKLPLNLHVYDHEQFQFLSYQIDRWQQTALGDVKGSIGSGQDFHSVQSDPIRTLLYLRANQMRILLLRPLYFANSSVKPDRSKVTGSVDIAVRTITVLQNLDSFTDHYRRQHPFFSHFLTSAVAIILMVVTTMYQPGDSCANLQTYTTHDIFQALNAALKLLSAYSSVCAHSAWLHRRLSSMVRLLCRLRILATDTLSEEAKWQQNPLIQSAIYSPVIPRFVESEATRPFGQATLPLNTTSISSECHEFNQDPLAFFEDGICQVDGFPNGIMWTDLSKQLTTQLNSLDSTFDMNGPLEDFSTISGA